MRIFVTGGTGLVGRRLRERLTARGDEVVLLSRRPQAVEASLETQVRMVEGDPTQPGLWQDAVRDCDAVVNLAGENLFRRRWSASFKQLLVRSRVESTRNVVDALRQDGAPR